MKSEFLEKAVFYEIYPTSFFDSNGDGVGDVRGMIEKIPYLKSLGIDGIWLNPLFVSPFKDGGYDIADYYRVDPRFGTNDDLKEFFEKTKECGIRVLLDLVMGHTSVEHPWFLESQKAEKNEYTDAFIWQHGSEPLNNKNGKCISGWAERPDMFMINFYVWQPALNYGFRKPKAKWQNAPHDDAPMKNRQRLIDVCKFWLSLGASGFRVDMANFMVKNDTPSHRANQEFWIDVIGRIKREYPDSVFVSEWFYPPQAVGKSAFDIDFNYGGPLYKVWGQKTIADSHKKCFFGEESSSAYYFAANQMFRLFHHGVKGKGYQAITVGNHDTERMAEGRSFDGMKTMMAYHFTAPHVPFLYYGDEVGMNYQFIKTKDGGYNRTGSRTPMQWTEGKNRGFSETDGALYLPVEDANGRSVAAQENVPDSLYETVKRFIHLKKELDCLRVDAQFTVLKGRFTGRPLLYRRRSERDECYVLVLPKKSKKKVRLSFLKNGAFESLTGNLKIENNIAITENGEAFGVFWKKRT